MSVVLLIVGCSEPLVKNQLTYGDITGEMATGYQPNKIRIKCHSGCITLYPGSTGRLTSHNKKLLKRRLASLVKNNRLYVAPCDNIHTYSHSTRDFVRQVSSFIFDNGIAVRVTKPVVAAKALMQSSCVNLVSGKLSIIAPNCPNLSDTSGVYRIGSNLECANRKSLAQMISNPWDLLAPGGSFAPVSAARLIHGNKDYRMNVNNATENQKNITVNL